MNSYLNTYFTSWMAEHFCCTEQHSSFLIDLMESAREGHLCMKREKMPPLPSGSIHQGSFSFEKPPLEPIVCLEDRFYLQRNWVYETMICKELVRLFSFKKADALASFSAPVQRAFEQGELNEFQAKAVEHALLYPVTVLAGGPGTGKTYTAKQIIRMLAETSPADVKRLYKVYLTAPTGKAAQHLQSGLSSLNLPIELKTDTLHRALGLMPGRCKLFTDSILDADLIVVDEASMIDVDLWAHLLKAVSNSSKLVIMGDPDQLPPVEAGSVFSDICDLFALRLEQCMRTDKKELQELHLAIRQGDVGLVKKRIEEGLGSFGSIDPKKLYEELSPPIFANKPDPHTALEMFQKTKILATLRQGPLGIDRLNELFLKWYQSSFRKGFFWAAPILITKNAPHLGLYNGMNGVFIGPCRTYFDLREATAYFPDPLSDKTLSFSPNLLPPYEWAFCLSVHKSQGSEFERVFALFQEGSERFGKEALYTAATRSKNFLHLQVDPNLLDQLMTRCSRKESGIVQRIKSLFSTI